jgi:hypothetical protein
MSTNRILEEVGSSLNSSEERLALKEIVDLFRLDAS